MDLKRIDFKKFNIPVLVLFSVLSGLFFSCISFKCDDIFMSQSADFLGFARAMLDGKILYRDLVDHKGVLQFVPALISQAISRTSLYPYFIMNIASRVIFTIVTYFFVKNHSKIKDISVFLQVFLVISLFYLVTLQFMDYLLVDVFFLETYLFVYDYTQTRSKPSFWGYFVIGLLIGAIFSIKYTLVLYFVPTFLFFTIKTRKNTSWKSGIFSILGGILGVVASLFPQIWYCTKFGVWDNFFDAMFLVKSNSGAIYICIGFGLLLTAMYGFVIYKDNRCVDDLLPEIALNIGILLAFPSFSFVPYLYAPILYLEILIWMCSYKKRKLTVSTAAFVDFVLICFIVYPLIINFFHYPTTKSVAMKYGITYENILYIGEDFGFGLYNEPSYKKGVTFLPSRVITEESVPNILEQYQPLLDSGEYEYVFLPRNKLFDPFEEVVSKNYEYAEKVRVGNIYKKRAEN